MNGYPDRETYKALYKRFYDGRKPEELLDLAGSSVSICIGRVRPLLSELLFYSHLGFDLAFCQQGVNYWLDRDTAHLVADVLKENGMFIFNTFNKKPSEKPMIKEYELDGKKFVETSWLVGTTVHHVQAREGMEPHTTSFQWLSPEYFEKILSPYFEIEVKNEGASALYRCSRK